MMASFTLFDTAIGACGIAWGERGIVSIQLPGRSALATRARMQRVCPGAREATPPADVQRAIDAIVALMRGERIDLSFVALDMEPLPAFNRRVYEAARAIPPGTTLTYGDV